MRGLELSGKSDIEWSEENCLKLKLQDDCVEAATSLGGILRHGNLIVGERDRTPKNCFLSSGEISQFILGLILTE